MDLFEYAQAQTVKEDETPASSKEAIYTVGEITAEIRSILEGRYGREKIWVKGEISNYRGRNQTGHIYFSLKDQDAVLGCAFFRNANKNLALDLKEGMEVLAGGRINVYPPRGTYQLIIEEIRAGGTGELYLRFELLKKKLEAEGLFQTERKRPLPPSPRRIGLITSGTGAVVRDVIHVVERRCPFVSLYLYPVRVQGDGASEEIARAIEDLNRSDLDLEVLIVARGGGSIEDLWAFNEEIVARAIAASKIPVISAVGHQTDFTIADFVADVRAATPSHAAEIVVPDMSDLRRRVKHWMDGMVREVVVARKTAVDRLRRLRQASPLRDPRIVIGMRADRIELAIERMAGRMKSRRDGIFSRWARCKSHLHVLLPRRVVPARGRFEKALSNLECLSPLGVIARGYSIVTGADRKVLKSYRQVNVGDHVLVQMSEGRLSCDVKEIHKN